MIRVHRLERLGNLLSQHCFARVLASRFSYTLAAPLIAGFSGTGAPVKGEEILGPEIIWEGQWPREAYSGRRLERAELFQPPGARITVRGWFQRFFFPARATRRTAPGLPTQSVRQPRFREPRRPWWRLLSETCRPRLRAPTDAPMAYLLSFGPGRSSS